MKIIKTIRNEADSKIEVLHQPDGWLQENLGKPEDCYIIRAWRYRNRDDVDIKEIRLRRTEYLELIKP